MEKKKISQISKQVFLDYMEISDFPKNRIVIDSLDVVQMISIGIERTLKEIPDEHGIKPAVIKKACPNCGCKDIDALRDEMINYEFGE